MPSSNPNQVAMFRDMHTAPELLVLPNAWDAGSAVIFQKAGFKAIGTSSAGIAYSLGRPDGQQATLDQLLHVVRLIQDRISVPLSVDMEAGYGADIAGVLHAVARVIDLGAVGINLEDGVPGGEPALADLAEHLELLRALADSRSSDRDFVINARTDSFWLGIGSPAEQLDTAIRRGNAFLDAGADCVFVPGRLDRGTIATLVAELHGPLNVIAAPGIPELAELTDMGVARLSLGSGPARAAYGTVLRIAEELAGGSLAPLAGTELDYAQANQLFI